MSSSYAVAAAGLSRRAAQAQRLSLIVRGIVGLSHQIHQIARGLPILFVFERDVEIGGCVEHMEQGPQGEAGAQGEQGEQGPQGKTGSRGPKGERAK